MANYLSAADISASGLAAERIRMQVIANNVANANTTHTDSGGPFRRQQVVFEPLVADALGSSRQPGSQVAGVRVMGVQSDPAPLPQIYDPGHPDADDSGFVTMPNVSVAQEMVDMITASRSYEANLQALRSLKSMVEASLALLRNA